MCGACVIFADVKLWPLLVCALCRLQSAPNQAFTFECKFFGDAKDGLIKCARVAILPCSDKRALSLCASVCWVPNVHRRNIHKFISTFAFVIKTNACCSDDCECMLHAIVGAAVVVIVGWFSSLSPSNHLPPPPLDAHTLALPHALIHKKAHILNACSYFYMEKFLAPMLLLAGTINTLLQIKRLGKQNNRKVLIMPFNGCTCSLF